MSSFDPAYSKPEARLSRASSALVIGALSAASWAGLIFAGFQVWRLF